MNVTAEPLVPRVGHRFDRLAPAGARCLVAVSGGPDSLALLDLLTESGPIHGRSLVVGHVDHGISNESGRIADQVAAAAAERGLPFHAVHLGLGPECSETRARTARRAALRRLAREAGCSAVVLGHHADDQVETVLLRLLRGSGPAGLAGMSPRRGIWLRPLLEVRHEELLLHLSARGISSWSDPANSDPRHLRSWLRGEILPRLSARLPGVAEMVLRSGRLAREARQGWDALPGAVPALEQAVTAHGISVAALPLRGYRSELRHAVLAAIGRRFGVPLGERRLRALDQLLSGEAADGVIHLSGGLEAELSLGQVTFRKRNRDPLPVARPLPAEGVTLVGEATLTTAVGPTVEPERGGWGTVLTPGRYVARTWRPGDRIRPLGGRGSRAVGVLFREARVSKGRRAGWPVVASEDDATIVWVPGICRSDSRIPGPGTEALHVECVIS